jgi:hypothetical protein
MEFLKIIVRYSTLSDEPEGDIVTSLWEKQLPHIRYEVADFFWGAANDADLMPAPDLEGSDRKPVEDRSAEWEPLEDPVIDQAWITLDPEERRQIGEMVEHEERGDPTGYLDALLDSLLQHHEQDSFEIILEVLEEEFKAALPRKDFKGALKILQGLQEILPTCTDEMRWCIPLLEDFFLTLSSSQSLGSLKDVWTGIDSRQLDTPRQVLMLLQPEAVSTLGPMLALDQPQKHRQVLVDVVAALSRQDPRPLEMLLKEADQRLMERLVHVVVGIEGELTTKMLRRLVSHASPQVRQEAVRELLRRGASFKKELLALISDRDPSVRGMILKVVSQTKNREAEDFLRDYLGRTSFKGADREHVIACFTALGKCGSPRSVPFLRETLFGKGILSMFGNSDQREGAFIALKAMNTREADQVLEEARRSLNPKVRSIVKAAR